MASSTANKKTKYDVSVLEEAVGAVQSGLMGLRKAARHFDIAVSTLKDKVKGNSPIVTVPRTLLTVEEETKLFEWTLQMFEVGFGLTIDDIRAMAGKILELRGGTTSGKDGTNRPSTAWVYRFFERHPQLSHSSTSARQFPSPAQQTPTKLSHPLIPESQPSTSASSCHSEEEDYTAKQLEALKDFALYVTDELGRNGFMRCFNAVSRNTHETHTGFERFKILTASLKSSFQQEKSVTTTRAHPTLEDILRVPNFSGQGKTTKSKITPTMHYMLSGAEHREAIMIMMKERAKRNEEKEKLARKTSSEKKARQRKEDPERKRLEAKVQKLKKAAEMERKRQERKDLALLKKMERETQRKRKHSESDDNDDRRLEKEMEQTMRDADDDDLQKVDVCENGGEDL